MDDIHELKTLGEILLGMTSRFPATAIPGKHLDMSGIFENLEPAGSNVVCLETTQAVYESAEKSDDFVFRYGPFLFIWANGKSTHLFWLDETSNQYFARRLDFDEAHLLSTIVKLLVHGSPDFDLKFATASSLVEFDPCPNESGEDVATKTKFTLGSTVITPKAQLVLHPGDVSDCLVRHSAGDWGDVSPNDHDENEFALDKRLRLFSVYHDRSGQKFWIITEADRSVTTILLPEDY